MSKTAQRKRSAYQNGYRIGRYGWPSGVKGYRIGVTTEPAWQRGMRDGARDRAAAERRERAWHHRLVRWIRSLFSRA